MLAEINRFARLKPVPARRLLTDRMLGLMMRLSRMRPDLPAAEIRWYCDRWLMAMGLTGQGDLETITLQDGRDAVIVARKGCCLDYLIAPQDYCVSCPSSPPGSAGPANGPMPRQRRGRSSRRPRRDRRPKALPGAGSPNRWTAAFSLARGADFAPGAVACLDL